MYADIDFYPEVGMRPLQGATAGSILFVGTNGVLQQDNANIFWDDANNRFALGTTAPAKFMEIVSTASDHLRLTHTATTKVCDMYTDSNGDLYVQPTTNAIFKLSVANASVRVTHTTDAASINFRSNTSVAEKSGKFELDTSGNFVFRQDTAGSMFFDFINSAIWRDSGFAQIIDVSSSGLTMHDAKNIILDTTTGTKIATATTQKLGFYNATPIVQPTDGATLTNNVTSGGTTDTIANFTDLTTYANDAATIRNDIYQLARKVKIITDNLRSLGLES